MSAPINTNNARDRLEIRIEQLAALTGALTDLHDHGSIHIGALLYLAADLAAGLSDLRAEALAEVECPCTEEKIGGAA